MRNHKLLITITILLSAICLSSCTFDYFEDETNYILYVPDVEGRSVKDCRVLVYDENGSLAAEKYGALPFEDNPRMQTGMFSFKLKPGRYRVFCYANTDSLLFDGKSNIREAAFSLPKIQEDRYAQPPALMFDTGRTPEIIHPGIIVRDTARLIDYTGRITVRFKNPPFNVPSIKKVEMTASGIANRQLLQEDTLTRRISSKDVEYHLGAVPVQNNPDYFELDYRFFPSIFNDSTSEAEQITLRFSFYDADGNYVAQDLLVPVVDKATGKPLRLLHNKRIIIIVDVYTIVKIEILPWDGDIQDEDLGIV